MSNVSQFPSPQEACVGEAGDWVARLGDGLTSEEEDELGKWLARDKRNYQVFMELAELWDSMDALSRLADIFPEPTTEQVRPTGRLRWLVAAAVLIGATLAMVVGLQDDIQTEQTVASLAMVPSIYETPIGEQAVYDLADGTKLILNTNTKISVQYSGTRRLLSLERGEVHVSVAHDPSRPLSVIAGNKIVQAVGTEFNLEITNDQTIELLVSDGVVLVGVLDAPPGDNDASSPLVMKPSTRLVATGQEVALSDDTQSMDAVEPTSIEGNDIAIKLSWRDGNLIFRGESLEEAVTEIGRYTAVEFVFLDEDSKQVNVAGLFKAGDVDGLLTALRVHFKIAYEWQGDDKIVLSKEASTTPEQ